MALLVPYLLHTLQQAARHAGLEADPCWHKVDNLGAKSGVSFHRIFPQGFLKFFLSKGITINPIKPQSFQEYHLNEANTLKSPCSRVRGSEGVPGVVSAGLRSLRGCWWDPEIQRGGLGAWWGHCLWITESSCVPPSSGTSLRGLKKVDGVKPSLLEGVTQDANSSQGIHSGQQWLQARCPALKGFWTKWHQAHGKTRCWSWALTATISCLHKWPDFSNALNIRQFPWTPIRAAGCSAVLEIRPFLWMPKYGLGDAGSSHSNLQILVMLFLQQRQHPIKVSRVRSHFRKATWQHFENLS